MKAFPSLGCAPLLLAVACGGDASTRTGTVGGSAQGGSVIGSPGGTAGGSGGVGNGGVIGGGGAPGIGGVIGGGGVPGSGGTIGSGDAPGIDCRTTADCPQTDCFGCPQLVCIDGRCVAVSVSGAGGALGAGGTSTAGGTSSAGGASPGAGGALPTCGTPPHLPACEEYARHTCALCDPAGCTESQLCYALTSCDSLYASCSTDHFACATAATTCAQFEACPRCQL